MMWLDGLLGFFVAFGTGLGDVLTGGSRLNPDGGSLTGGSRLNPDG